VSHALGSPASRPALNHFDRCAEVPCVKVSGLTDPVARRCSLSSPTACEARIASSTSPASRTPAW